jgi:hypothetical protein
MNALATSDPLVVAGEEPEAVAVRLEAKAWETPPFW